MNILIVLLTAFLVWIVCGFLAYILAKIALGEKISFDSAAQEIQIFLALGPIDLLFVIYVLLSVACGFCRRLLLPSVDKYEG
jgi:cation transporter-like permease